MNWKILVALVSLSLSLSGCAHVQRDGFTLDKGGWEKSEEAVLARGSFELRCAKTELRLTVLAAESGSGGYPNTIGVEGCGKQATYIRPRMTLNWVLNSAQ